MIEKQTKKEDNNNSVELEASLAPAEAQVRAMAKADQYFRYIVVGTSAYLLFRYIIMLSLKYIKLTS